MLRYFIEKDSIQQIRNICNSLNQAKRRLKAGDFSNSCKEYDSCKDLFESVLQMAIKDNDEKLANAQYVFKQYFLLFCNLTCCATFN